MTRTAVLGPGVINRVWTCVYPGLFGAAYVLLSFAAFPTPTVDLVRPLAIVFAATPLLVLVVGILARGISRAALIVSALLVAASAPILLVSVMTAVLVVIAVQFARRRLSLAGLRQVSAHEVSRGASVFAFAFAMVAAAMAAPVALGGWFGVDRPARGDPDPGMPNIYLILLDGYPRTDTLNEVYGYDNAWFETRLEELEFDIARGSRSNYAHTWLTLASMLNGAFVADIDGLKTPPDEPVEQYRRLMVALNQAAMTDRLRVAGYEILTIPSPFRSVALSTADRYLDTGQLTAFEYSLLLHSQVAPLVVTLAPDFLMGQQRDRFHDTLDRLVTIASGERDAPAFVFAHLFSPPHAPLVYGRNGEPLPLPDCVPACTLWEHPHSAWVDLADQVHYTNGEVLEAVTRMVRADPEGIVILMSDHGTRRDWSDLDEFFHTFFAARTPAEPIFPSDVSPVNVMRLLVSATTGQQLPLLPYRAWMFSDETEPLDLTRVEPSP